MPDRTSAVTANTAVLAADEQLPLFDGSQIALATWLRELQRYEHLLPSDLAYWLVTGSASTAAGKTAVLSVRHAHLLYRDAVELHGFNVINPPPIEDKFLALYTATRAAGLPRVMMTRQTFQRTLQWLPLPLVPSSKSRLCVYCNWTYSTGIFYSALLPPQAERHTMPC